MSKISETKTENIFRKFYGNDVFLEKSGIPEEYDFKSKKSNSNRKGYPDFFKEISNDFIIIVEAKARDIKLASKEVQKYMKDVNSNYNVLGISIAGQKALNVEHFLSLKSTKKIENINIKELLNIDELVKNYEKHALKIDYKNLMDYKSKLNDIFDKKFKMDVKNRPFFFASLLFSLNKIEEFLRNIKIMTFGDKSWDELDEMEMRKHINDSILKETEKKFRSSTSNQNKIIYGLSKFQFIKENDYIKIEQYLYFLRNFVFIFSNYKRTSKYYDIVGNFYTEFLRYVQKDGGQDIVLTPDHIKIFMCNLLEINHRDVILDTCTGTAGLLATAFGILLDKLEEKGMTSTKNKEHIKEKQLIGIEKSIELYPLAFSNMVLHGDGKSNLFKGDSFSNFKVDKNRKLEDVINSLKPTKGIINPPYNDNKAPSFVNRLLNLLNISKTGKLACIIAPSNCFVKNPNNINKKIFENNKLLKIIKINEKLFSNQNIAAHTSIYLFRVGESHDKKQNVYFYDFTNDDFHYSSRKMEDMGDFKTLMEKSLDHIKNNTKIEGKSYVEKIDYNDSEKLQYIRRIKYDVEIKDIIEKVLDFEIFKLRRKYD